MLSPEPHAPPRSQRILSHTAGKPRLFPITLPRGRAGPNPRDANDFQPLCML